MQNIILQRFNHNVFKNPLEVAENMAQVCTELVASGSDYQILTPVQSIDNQYFVTCGDQYWRAFYFIENSVAIDSVANAGQAYQAARAFGNFVFKLKNLSPSELHTIIPDFHNGEKRLRDFYKSVEKDACGRVEDCKDLIDFVHKNQKIIVEVQRLIDEKTIPQRAIHYDTKINNVLFDSHLDKVIAVIDLDTVMSGVVLSDFGDLVRTCSPTFDENESDATKIECRPEIFEAILDGYLDGVGDILLKAELENLMIGAKNIILIQAIRFFTDYLVGDVYYPIKYKTHNLVRAKNQFALYTSILRQENYLNKLIFQKIKTQKI